LHADENGQTLEYQLKDYKCHAHGWIHAKQRGGSKKSARNRWELLV